NERGRFSPAVRLQLLGESSHARHLLAAEHGAIYARHGLELSFPARHAGAHYAGGVAVAGTLARPFAEFLCSHFGISKCGVRARTLGGNRRRLAALNRITVSGGTAARGNG